MSDTAARLIVRQGPYLNQEYLLTQTATVMGRGPNNDIVFADPEVSRQHAQIIQETDGQYILKDLGSTNGLFINGRRVSGSTPLNNGDSISLGESIVLVFSLPGEFYDEDDTPTAEMEIQPQPSVSTYTATATTTPSTYEPQPSTYTPSPAPITGSETYAAAPPYPQPTEAGRRGRPVLIGCGILLLLVFLCLVMLFFLDAYDNGRLLYCGGLRPLWETFLGPLGFAPICG